MQYLNLQGNQILDKGAIELCQLLIRNNSLVSLNISQNKLTNYVAPYVQDLLCHHRSLKELYLRWNKFTGTGGYRIL